ncbi:hypothetical protein A2954_01900 [Candidatus Roizmanbacteria bacterium RIFCSPLOWO2_01_FULL_37_12]|uniref:Uncharacterized protein n=1 Tax=Candidatus Roizmanbacteria bacterium RIFCSPLOWO2_01_FULL_37_12 TaxID=1802056 RepID=A0A1F7I9J0_9BACT|nr:MAG: hypothetical protein A2768_01385 [Candidatus Roizmanbacteria bacterium RIFCSPHIGHO2_01_FULL_37_16]OGK23273.1 MAG: hypothetical protein A3D76_00620 [Candidatus Roizmanbacteria bacterium RIFCSPHIGHO2_02_FULL_37_9b]OGK40045.1 MAG: hypothetical protein A2954_01900 [Candidatus Roizmanbacteria bacterium RIFCSPLOWO2_01_FULL_37_12]
MFDSNYNEKEVVTRSYPKVVFQLNQNLDAEMENFDEIDFLWHPELAKALKKTGGEKNKIINEYVINFYEGHRDELETARSVFQAEWDEVQPEFFNITDKLFNNHQWPAGRYLGFPSIFNSNQRFLETKTFQIFSLKNDVGVPNSVAHEMLHFIFYDYLEKNYREYVKEIGGDKLWALSEIFDDLAFEQPEYAKFKAKIPSFYQQLQPTVSTFREKLIGKPFNIESFIDAAKNIDVIPTKL